MAILPFLKNKTQQAGVIVKTRAPDESEPKEIKKDSELDELEEVIKDFRRALEAGDVRRMAEIVRMAHDVLHDYMSVGNRDEDYDSQNAKAGEQE